MKTTKMDTKLDYSDPLVRALLSPVVIGRLKEILAEGEGD